MKTMFTFPGQGTQIPQMLHQLPDSKITQHYLESASEILQENCLLLDREESLQYTRSVQICLLLSGVIHAKILIDKGIKPDLVSGLSIGAFPAAVISGVLDFTDAVQIVSLRGQLMQEAYPTGYGMSAIIGLDEWQVKKLVEQWHTEQTPVYIANINSDRQIVISGKKQTLAQVCALAEQNGASKTVPIQIQIPSHCPLLAKQAQILFQEMQNYTWHTKKINYISGSTGRVYYQTKDIILDLAFNMGNQTRWYEAASASYERGIRLAIEMPPGNTLTSLTKPLMPAGEAVAVSQTQIGTIQYLYKNIESR